MYIFNKYTHHHFQSPRRRNVHPPHSEMKSGRHCWLNMYVWMCFKFIMQKESTSSSVILRLNTSGGSRFLRCNCSWSLATSTETTGVPICVSRPVLFSVGGDRGKNVGSLNTVTATLSGPFRSSKIELGINADAISSGARSRRPSALVMLGCPGEKNTWVSQFFEDICIYCYH